jgi:hypothetical protein
MPVGGVSGQDEIPDLAQVTVMPLRGHENEQEHVIDGHPAGSDVGERDVAIGAAPVLIAASAARTPVMGPRRSRAGAYKSRKAPLGWCIWRLACRRS